MARILDLDPNSESTKKTESGIDPRFSELEILGTEKSPEVRDLFSKKNEKKAELPTLDLYSQDYHIEFTKADLKMFVLVATLHDGNRFVFLSDDDSSWSPIGEFYNRTILLPLDKSPLTVGLINLLKESPSHWEPKGFQYKFKRMSSTIKKRKG